MLNLIKKLFYILPKGDPFKVAILFVMMLVAAGLEVIGIGMIPAFVSIVASPEQVLGYEPLQFLWSALDITTDRDLLIWGSVALVGIFILKSIYIVFFNYVEARFIFNRRYMISHRLMSSYMQAPYTFHLGINTSELLRNLTSEVNIIVNHIMTNLLKMSREGLMAVSILLFLFTMEPLITMVVMLFSGIGAGSFLFLTQKKMKAYGEQEQGHRRKMIQAINQGLGGIKDARVLNREQYFIEKFRTEVYDSTRLLAWIRYIQQIPKPVVETTAVLGMMMISALMVWQGRAMSTIIPILTLFAMATVRLMPAIQQLSSMYTAVRYNLVAIDPIYDDLTKLAEYRKQFLEDRKSGKKMTLEKQIKADSVSYSYPGSDELALSKVSFEIPRGKAVAFVGESGAGKTTIVDLLLGLLEPTGGEIMVDGRNIHEKLSAWQINVGYIPQSIYLADETLRNNIAFGVQDDEIDDKKVMEAIESASLSEMVSRLPNGLDTMIGENGTRISGGQRQRVGIARALYHNPQVLVMDEATSALDNITEKEITRAIETLKGERTIIMIAHRLTTVENCDRLYLMKDGKIVDEGSYGELVEKNKEFRKMALVE
ncbi:ABC transporter ATP-binding protein [Rhodohalobacter barkolensis]|uniref:ABC transporter ATP-binding protein n=1 Tax=Rhodohalobacter barkolensis TaxID=2053187 RepID=A0A2N0VGF2_9BACT|nr:ABC transporter ATP-binding protein [Rhodohalobacter barkolensis]PKD43271.1 ABC transporter ATP-binding protein [Rhodohalobacter barkolensis]